MKNVKLKVVFIRVNESVSIADAVAHLESLGYENGWTEGFVPPVASTQTISGDSCGLIGWCKNPSWSEENGYEEIFLPATKHKHYDLIVRWAGNPSQKVWYKGSGDDWRPVEISPSWRYEYDWHIGEQPPKRKIMIGDVEIDAPELHTPARGLLVYITMPTHQRLCLEDFWRDTEEFRSYLKRGLVHLNKEAAIAHAIALIKVSGGCVDE